MIDVREEKDKVGGGESVSGFGGDHPEWEEGGGGRGGNTRGSAGGDPPSTCIAATPTQLWKPCRAIIEWRRTLDWRFPPQIVSLDQQLGQPGRHEGANGADKDYIVNHWQL